MFCELPVMAPPRVKVGMVRPVPAPTVPWIVGEVKVLLVRVWVAARVTTVSDESGKVNVVESVPEKAKVLLAVRVLPLAIVKVPVEVVIVRPSYVALVMAPVADMSQSEVLIRPVSPLSPNMNLPDVWKLPEMEAAESRKTFEFTSRSPEMSKSLAAERKPEYPVVSVPNREYAAEL